jgi:uncharacterized protein (DUF849 family)
MKGMQTSDYIWKYGDAYEWMTRTRKSALPPLIVSCAITGGIQGKEMNPNLPETPEEQVEQAYDAYNAGASIIHIHARNPHKLYEPSADPQDYRRVDSLIRAKCPDVIINHTTGGGPGMSLENRIRSLDADPEMASLNLGPYVWKFKLRAREHPLSHPRPEKLVDMCVPVGYSDVEAFARAMKQRGIKPELELFHQGMFWVMRDLISQDLLAAPYLVYSHRAWALSATHARSVDSARWTRKGGHGRQRFLQSWATAQEQRRGCRENRAHCHRVESGDCDTCTGQTDAGTFGEAERTLTANRFSASPVGRHARGGPRSCQVVASSYA